MPYDHGTVEFVDHTALIERSMHRAFTRLLRSALMENLIDGYTPLTDGLDGDAAFQLETPDAIIRIICENRVANWRSATLSHLEIVSRDDGSLRHTRSPVDVLEIVRSRQGADFQDGRWAALLQEINNSIYNEALCMAFRERQNVHITHEASRHGVKTLVEWARLSYPDGGASTFFEQWGAVGHPHHPCSKTKLGFSNSDLLKYSPEFCGVIPIILMAGRHDYFHTMSMSGADNIAECFRTEFPETMVSWTVGVEKKGLDPARYLPVPVHPWQLREVIAQQFRNELNDDLLVDVGGAVIPCRSTMSLRTLCPVGARQNPHLKLPLSVQATSAVRDLPPEHAVIGPELSDLFKGILARDAETRETLAVASEFSSAYFSGRDSQSSRSRKLGVILRTNVETLHVPTALSVPVAALFVVSPIANKPLFLEIGDCFGRGNLSAMRQYAHQYLRLVVSAFLGLYVKYGIGLEAHQQNAIVVFDSEYRPTSVIARDLGSTVIWSEAARHFKWSLSESVYSRVVREDRADVRNVFIYYVLQSHISEIINLLAEYADMKQDDLWRVVGAEIRRILDDFDGPWGVDLIEEDRHAILIDPWKTKSLLRARLADSVRDGFMESANPLLQ